MPSDSACRRCIAHHPLHSKFLEAAKLLVDRENEHKAALTRTQREAGPPPAHIQVRLGGLDVSFED